MRLALLKCFIKMLGISYSLIDNGFVFDFKLLSLLIRVLWCRAETTPASFIVISSAYYWEGTEGFKLGVRIHHGSVALVIDRLIDEVRQESLWTILFADEIVICSESSGTVELSLQRWRYVLERRGMKSSTCKTEYICVNERERDGCNSDPTRSRNNKSGWV